MQTFPAPRWGQRRPGPWPRVVILVIILGFVITLTVLGVSPDVAAGIGASALAAACSASGEGLPDAEG